VSDNRSEVNAALHAWAKRIDEAAYRATRIITSELATLAHDNANQVWVAPDQKGNTLGIGKHVSGGKNWDGSEPPNRRTGTLVGSIHGNPVQKGFNGYTASAVAEAEYARDLETKYRVKYMFMTPARDYLVKTGRARQYLIQEIRKVTGA
jgi:hypothetical protein